ncbi:MAG: Fe-S cluster assembly protein SufB, partial [Alistipes sp.]|nr:Fe-S cluster assembly protein SufB [Alistipes sp.]
MGEKNREILDALEGSEYQYGFTSDIETETIRKGLDEDIIRLISQKKGEPEWLLDYRLKAYRHWLTMPVPEIGRA